MTEFFKEGTFWCDEKPVSLALLTIAKRRGYYPILGIDGFLTYSRRELREANAKLPYDLIQGKGSIDIAFFDNKVIVIGGAATTTYAFIEYMKFPEKTFHLYTKTIFSEPQEVIKAYKELKDIGLRLPAYVVGKLYKSILMLKANARLRRLISEGRNIIVFSLIPFYAPKNVIAETPKYIGRLVDYMASEHGISINDYNVLLIVPQSIDDKPPKNLYFKCIHCGKECLLGEKIMLEDFPDIISGLRGCKGCRYLEICTRSLMKPSEI